MTARIGLFSIGGLLWAGILKWVRQKLAPVHRFVFGIILNQLSDLDQRIVDMDEEELVAIIKQPDRSILDTPARVARNCGPAESVLTPTVPSQHLVPIAL